MVAYREGRDQEGSSHGKGRRGGIELSCVYSAESMRQRLHAHGYFQKVATWIVPWYTVGYSDCTYLR